MAHVSRIRKKYKPTRDFGDHCAKEFWKSQVDAMIRRSDAARVAQGKDMEYWKNRKTALGYNVANYTMEDYIRITTQYGPEAYKDREFIRDYNKFVPTMVNSI